MVGFQFSDLNAEDVTRESSDEETFLKRVWFRILFSVGEVAPQHTFAHVEPLFAIVSKSTQTNIRCHFAVLHIVFLKQLIQRCSEMNGFQFKNHYDNDFGVSPDFSRP